ncbi:MAG: amidohydrolase [Caldilineaceae bacterium]|nr:amidohydrolase [Caldilineaceae bacterium]
MTQHADIIITNAQVYTVDRGQPWAEAVAVRGNKILFVGSAVDANDLRGPRTEVIDGGGHTLLPGFIDTHYHLLHGSLGLDAAQLRGARSLPDLGETLRVYAQTNPNLEWILGRQVVYNIIRPDQPLDRHFLDRYVPDRPVFLTAFDGHTYWANTEALRRGGILHGREDVGPNSEIVMDPTTGMATGELREPPAARTVRELIPPADEARKRTLLRKGLQQAAELGVTSAHNMDGSDEQLRLYAALADTDELTLRVYVPMDVKPHTAPEDLEQAVAWTREFNEGLLRTGCVKFFMDGVLESYTALMVDDYADDAGNRGSALFEAEHFNRMAAAADKLGLQIFVHACGDGAVRRTLDGYAHAQQVNGARDSRHRIEHIEVVHPDDIPRFAQLGVIAAMQPLHAPLHSKDADIWPHRAGRARWQYSFAWETLRQAGARLAYGSDWPVVSQDPLLGIHAALNRRIWQAADPHQAQTLDNIIRGYTLDAAYAEFQEDQKGMLRTGMLADLVLLSTDLFAAAPEDVEMIRPVLTMCDGRIVYR